MGLSGAKYVGFIRAVVGIFMFGIQTFFISKSITYLIRIFIYYNLDSQILDGQVFLAFFPLILTYFTGPIGLSIYWLLRIFYSKKIDMYD